MTYYNCPENTANVKKVAGKKSTSIKSSLTMLLFFAPMLCSSPAVLAQQEPATGWAISDQEAAALEESAAEPASKLASEQIDDQAVSSKPESSASEETPEDTTEEAIETADEQTPPLNSNALSSSPDTIVTPAPRPEIPTTPILDLSDAQRAQLAAQFEELQALKDTEDAFSERLGETYFSYAAALQDTGQLEEARKLFAQALHIAKVNNGVNSIEQRPMLRSLFHLELAQGDLEQAEEYVKRMIWVEKQHPDVRDTYTFDAVRDIANEYVDQYLFRPVAGDSSIFLLDSAARYFRYAINRYGDQPLEQLVLPYGELAYVQYLKSKLSNQYERLSYQDTRQRARGFEQFDRRQQRPVLRPTPTIRNPLGGSERYIREYLAKAEQSQNQEHAVKALLNLGDINLLFGRKGFAEQYYREAWRLAQDLAEDHELVLGMQEPVKLPAFFYSQDRPEIEKFNPEVTFPLEIAVSEDGKVSKVFTDPDASETPKIAQRARRLARRLSFRPAIEGGKMVGTDRIVQDVRVLVRRAKSSDSSAGN